MEYGGATGYDYVQKFLALGLQKLYKIASAETYNDRVRILCSYHTWYYSSYDLFGFLCEALKHYANEQHDNIWLDELPPEDELLHVKQPFFADPDPGPADVWKWAHYRESDSTWVFQENRLALREWGYVMWDRSRLEATGVFQEPWMEDVEDVEDGEDADARNRRNHEGMKQQRQRMRKSWARRKDIFDRGGSLGMMKIILSRTTYCRTRTRTRTRTRVRERSDLHAGS